MRNCARTATVDRGGRRVVQDENFVVVDAPLGRPACVCLQNLREAHLAVVEESIERLGCHRLVRASSSVERQLPTDTLEPCPLMPVPLQTNMSAARGPYLSRV